MANPTLTFEQALPYLRRGLIMRAHGGSDWDKIELREEQGKIEFSRGDGSWMAAGDVPLMELSYDVYDQKKQPNDAAAKLQRAEPLSPFTAQQKVRIIDGNELVTVEATQGTRVRVKRDDGNVDWYDVEQLKSDEEYSFGGGNSPAQVDASTNADAVNSAAVGGGGGVRDRDSDSDRKPADGSSFGINAGQVEQAKHGAIENTDEHRVEPDADHSHDPVEPDGIPEDASRMVESGENTDDDVEPAGADNESEGGVNPDHGGKKKKKGKLW